MADDPHELCRFVKAQNPVYAGVLRELAAGCKATHWMWFVFPQVAGLGASAMSQRYAIAGLDEAKAYLAHPILGPRLLECARLVNRHSGRSARDVLGTPDDVKLHACATLFAHAGGGTIFNDTLEAFFGGREHEATLKLLDAAQPSKT